MKILVMIITKTAVMALVAKMKILLRKMIVTNEKTDKIAYLDITDAKTTDVLKNNQSVMINQAQFEFGLRLWDMPRIWINDE